MELKQAFFFANHLIIKEGELFIQTLGNQPTKYILAKNIYVPFYSRSQVKSILDSLQVTYIMIGSDSQYILTAILQIVDEHNTHNTSDG